MGLRGPKPVDLPVLKVNAVQWLYLLFGLRDGHPDAWQQLVWGDWTGKPPNQLRAAKSVRIQLVRIIPDGTGREIVAQVFEEITMFGSRTGLDDPGEFKHPIYRQFEKDTDLPLTLRFGLKPTEHPCLFFPALSPVPHLWGQLKTPRSIRQLQQTLNDIYDWLVPVVDDACAVPEFRRALCDYPAELFRIRKLWNYPGSNRPTSDDKRIEFFAEALAGLMLEIAPATATKKLSRWNPPKLWITNFEGDEKS